MHRRLGAFSQPAIVSKDSSNSSVVRFDALDWPRCTFSYDGTRLRYRSSSWRGGWVLAALFVTIRPLRDEIELLADAVDVEFGGAQQIHPRPCLVMRWARRTTTHRRMHVANGRCRVEPPDTWTLPATGRVRQASQPGSEERAPTAA